MELCTLHPIEESLAGEMIAGLRDGSLPAWLGDGRTPAPLAAANGRSPGGRWSEREANRLTYAFARLAASRRPAFFCGGIGLTTWEARIDRGIGMLMRPPARLFMDAGLAPALARALPIRLDPHQGMMGGAYVPARLAGDLERLLDSRLERHVRRLIEAEMDGITVMAGMLAAAGYARANGLALFEAMDVVTPDGEPLVPGGQVIVADRRALDKDLLRRLTEAAKPPKKPGLWSRLAGRPERPVAGGQGPGEDGAR